MKLKKFQEELKNKLKMKANKRNTSSKILLECFKYYDYQNRGLADYKMFSMVVLIKLGINLFSEEDLTLLFDHYLNSLNREGNSFYYREFVSSLFDVNLTNISIR